MKIKKKQRFVPADLIKHLDRIFDQLYDPFRDYKSNGSTEWLGMLFRCEALRGCMQSLRRHRSLRRAITTGKIIASISIRAWNRKKLERARRTELRVGQWLESTINKYKKRVKEK